MLGHLSCSGLKYWSCLFPAVSFMLSSVTLDLSQYAMDIGKAIASMSLMNVGLIKLCFSDFKQVIKTWNTNSKVIPVCVSGQLKANNAQLMEEAVQAMQNLAQQCSDPTAVQDIVTHLFKILGGEWVDASLNEILFRSCFAFAHFKCNCSVCRVWGKADSCCPKDECVVR